MGFVEILRLIGSLGLFIYGMKLMSEGIQKSSGDSLRKFLGSFTKNKYFGILTGLLVTTLVQSSSATTVMTVSFVNAGLLTLVESAGVMLGANVGTTVTGWLVVLLGFKIKIASFSLPILGIGVPLIFFTREKLKFVGEFIIGFALLFWGLDELKNSVPDIKSNPELLYFLGNYINLGFLSNVLFVIIGALLTIIIQSSSASMTLTIALCAKGVIPYEMACAMVLGENIGTTITAELASLVGNTNAKRSARIHSLFNVIGVSWMVLIISFTPFLKGLSYFTESIFNLPRDTTQNNLTNIAVFHTVFNVLNVLITINFLSFLVRLAQLIVKNKEGDEDQFYLERTGTSLIDTTEISLVVAKKEISVFSQIILKMNTSTKILLLEQEEKKIKKIVEKIYKYEKITDKLEHDLAHYITKITRTEMTLDASFLIHLYLNISRYLERMADNYFQISKVIQRKNKGDTYFIPQQRNSILELIELTEKILLNMNAIIDGGVSKDRIEKSRNYKRQLNEKRREFDAVMLRKIGKKLISFQSGVFYTDIINYIDRIGDMAYTINQIQKNNQ